MPFGQVNIPSKILNNKFNISQPGITRTSLLALLAFDEALKYRDFSSAQLSYSYTAFINASTVGGMYLADDLYRDANKRDAAWPFLTSYRCV